MRRPEAQRRQGDRALDTCSACAKFARSVFGQARLFAFLLNGARSTKLVLAASTAIVLASAGVLAAGANDALNGPAAAISLSQAVTAAEQHVTGKATRAEYEHSRVRGQWVYDVEVAVGDE